MKKLLMLFCAGALISILFVGCNELKQDRQQPKELGLGEEIPGMEIKKATGTVIGSYSNGFISILVQVDEEYPIGKTIEYVGSMSCSNLPADGTYQNMIQVQYTLLAKIGDRGSGISFSFREYNKEKDIELFQRGAGNAMCVAPDVPIYTITEYEILNN